MKRVISGTCYVIVLLTFFLLKIFVHDFFFDGMLYAFALIGTFEITRALKDRITPTQKAVAFVFTAVVIPACAVCEEYFQGGLQVVSGCFVAYLVITFGLLVFDYKETSLESLAASVLSVLYPTLLICIMVVGNHAEVPASMAEFAMDSRLMMLLIFTISPCADTIAFVFGCTMKKFMPQKLAPEISPNKTVIGGIGGLVGGMLGAAVLYFVYNGLLWGTFTNMHIWLPIYILLGLLGALASTFGDLVESGIKRKLEIKDMGCLMPGHGGILDRIDGTLFTAVIIYAAFMLIHAVL